MNRRSLAGWGIAVLFVTFACPIVDVRLRGDDKKADAKDVLKGKPAAELIALKREVDALEKLYHLEPTAEQLSALLALAEKSAAHPPAATEARAGSDYRQTLRDLRDAFLNEDEDKIDALQEKMTAQMEKDAPELDDPFELTDAAVAAAPAALKRFRAAQIVSFLSALDDEVPDPTERLLSAIREGEGMDKEEWESFRDDAADEVAWLVAGFHNESAQLAKRAAGTLLDRGHRLKADDLEKEMPQLRQAAQKLVGGVSPIAIVDHYVQRELAELLANPQAVAAIRGRLERMKK